MSRRRPPLLTALLFSVLFAQSLCAQHTSGGPADTSAVVPALREFHTTIFKIWHTAWPNKDYAMLRALLPEITTGRDAIASANLPGILRDKSDMWKKGVDRLSESVASYASAVAGDDDEKLLRAAEDLHGQYEALVRTIRPPIKEIESFHSVLYIVFHYYMPGDSLDRIASAVDELNIRMSALKSAALPQRFADKELAFGEARTRLGDSLEKLTAIIPSRDLAKIKPAVNAMHAAYEDLVKTLE